MNVKTVNEIKKIEHYLSLMATNDKEALSDFYQLTKNEVYGYALSIVKNKEDASDIMQNVFIQIYRNCHNYKSNGKPMAWILTITRNASYEILRHSSKKQTVDIDLFEIQSNEMNQIDNLLLKECLSTLAQIEYEIVVLHAISGLKHKEIAKILNLPLSTTLSKYHRAMKKLKQKIKEEA